MTKRRGFLWRGLAALVLLFLLVGGGLAAHYVGWARGYQAGQLAVEGEEAAPLPYPHPPAWGMYHRPMVGGFVLRLLLLVLFLIVVGKLVRFVLWGRMFHPAMAGPRFHGRGWHHRRFHGPPPPWFEEWQAWKEQASDTEQDKEE